MAIDRGELTGTAPTRRTTGRELETMIIDRRLVVSGELDSLSAPRLHRELASLDGLVDTIDIGGVTFVDSSGVRALVAIRRRHPQLPIEHATEMTLRLLRILGIPDLLDPEA
jgi:anti-anti-sigma factor